MAVVMIYRAALVVVAAAAVLASVAAAVVHPVGGDGNWDASGSSYDAWSAAQKFAPGDSIAFTYQPSHDVVEVSKAGYDACSATPAVASFTGGKTTVKLTAPGNRYFICGIPGHCAAGMKLAVTVSAAAAPAGTKPTRGQRSVAPTTAPAPVPDASATTTDEDLPAVTSPAGAPPPKSSGAAGSSIGARSAAAALLATAMAVALAM